MNLPALFAPVVTFFLSAAVIRFVVFIVCTYLIAVFFPLAESYILPFIAPRSLTDAFSGISSGMWFFLDFFALDRGLPLVIAAFVARFVIRRMPLIG